MAKKGAGLEFVVQQNQLYGFQGVQYGADLGGGNVAAVQLRRLRKQMQTQVPLTWMAVAMTPCQMIRRTIMRVDLVMKLALQEWANKSLRCTEIELTRALYVKPLDQRLLQATIARLR